LKQNEKLKITFKIVEIDRKRRRTMNKFLRAIFILVILTMLSAAIIQIFLPHLLGEKSAYGLSIHWQREIGFWNLAILPLLLAVKLKYD